MIDRWSTLRSGACAGWSLAVAGSGAASAAPPAARSGAAALSAPDTPEELDCESSDAPAPQPASRTPVRSTEEAKYRGRTRMVFSHPRSGVHLGRTAHGTRFRQTAG